jgi:hypothetical protein
VFDRHCARCHDYGRKEDGGLNLAADREMTFNASYTELWRKNYVAAIGAGPADIQQAYSWGSHKSKLVNVLRAGHQDVNLPAEDFERIVTWIDINGPYYPRYDTAYPDNLAGRSPLNDAQVQRLTQLTGVPIAGQAGFASHQGPQVSFERPEVSPCLACIADANSPEYAEALGIIRAGKAMLQSRPRADMAGFQACPIDEQRESTYVAREEAEARNRAAIREGRKQYDDKP